MTGLSKYSDKDRRRQRRRNEFARELGDPRYRQRVVPGHKPEDNDYRRNCWDDYTQEDDGD